VACAAFTEQDRSGTHRADGCGQGGENGSGAEAGPLRERLAAATTAGQLHQLLLRHAGELQGPEVAAALEAAAKRRLLSGTDAAAGGGRGGAALAQLLVQLAAAHAPAMAPASLAASAWSMGVLQLPAARPVLRAMHATAHERLTQYQPSQLCALLWAGSVLDPSFHSPLFLALAGLLQQGMSLSLFAPADLAMLGWLCGREGGAVARDVLLRLTDECRLRLEAYRALAAEADAERERGAADAAGAQVRRQRWASWFHACAVRLAPCAAASGAGSACSLVLLQAGQPAPLAPSAPKPCCAPCPPSAAARDQLGARHARGCCGGGGGGEDAGGLLEANGGAPCLPPACCARSADMRCCQPKAGLGAAAWQQHHVSCMRPLAVPDAPVLPPAAAGDPACFLPQPTPPMRRPVLPQTWPFP
jgi:hypothetical protein